MRLGAIAMDPRTFIEQQVSPIFFHTTAEAAPPQNVEEITLEQDFWEKSGRLLLGMVRLRNFRLSDWFPRAPGVHWSRSGLDLRRELSSFPLEYDIKMDVIERGGIGTIRLRPRKIDGVDCWLATAGTGSHCHSGVPLAIPDAVLRQSGVEWGNTADITGRVRFIQDAGLDDIARAVHGARPVIVFVEELRGTRKRLQGQEHAIIAPVVLFDSEDRHGSPQYSFVQCADGFDAELDGAIEWFHIYSARYRGRIITNFDEQRPVLADAPLSYQRLVKKTYDRTVIEKFSGTMIVERLDKVIHQETIVGSITNTGILAINSTLTNVTQTINAAEGLDSNQKSELDALVKKLNSDLDAIKASHTDEVKLITNRLNEAVCNAAKPSDARKKNLLEFSAKGLTDAAGFVKDIAPSILSTAGLIAKFITGL
jgi:hypothetical protein